MLTKRPKVSAVRRRIKRRGSSKLVSHKKLRKYVRKTARKVMRGGEPKKVEIFVCYRGEKVPLTDDLTTGVINTKKITQLQMCTSIISPDTLGSSDTSSLPNTSSSLDTSKIIGLLFKRTEYDWKFFVFGNFSRPETFADKGEDAPDQITLIQKYMHPNYDDDDILEAIRILSQDENLDMNIAKTLGDNIGGAADNFRMFLIGNRSLNPFTKNNLILIDKGISDEKFKKRNEVTVKKEEPMNGGDPTNSTNIHFLNLTKIPGDLPDITVSFEYFKNELVKEYDRSYINASAEHFDIDGYLCKYALNIYNSIKGLITNSVKILNARERHYAQKRRSEKYQEEQREKQQQPEQEPEPAQQGMGYSGWELHTY